MNRRPAETHHGQLDVSVHGHGLLETGHLVSGKPQLTSTDTNYPPTVIWCIGALVHWCIGAPVLVYLLLVDAKGHSYESAYHLD